MDLADNIDKYKELEETRVTDWVNKHNANLKKINDIETYRNPLEVSKAEYYYSQAQIYAYLIASYYRGIQRKFEGEAEIEQANSYEEERTKNDKSGTDAQYLCRKAKGEKLIQAGKYEADYMRWSGIAKSYENAINSLKDMYKVLTGQGG